MGKKWCPSPKDIGGVFKDMFRDFVSACTQFKKSVDEDTQEGRSPDIVILESLLQAARDISRPRRSILESLRGLALELNFFNTRAYEEWRAEQEKGQYIEGMPGILREIYKRQNMIEKPDGSVIEPNIPEHTIKDAEHRYREDNELPLWVRNWIRSDDCRELCADLGITYDIDQNDPHFHKQN